MIDGAPVGLCGPVHFVQVIVVIDGRAYTFYEGQIWRNPIWYY